MKYKSLKMREKNKRTTKHTLASQIRQFPNPSSFLAYLRPTLLALASIALLLSLLRGFLLPSREQVAARRASFFLDASVLVSADPVLKEEEVSRPFF